MCVECAVSGGWRWSVCVECAVEAVRWSVGVWSVQWRLEVECGVCRVCSSEG